MPNYTQRAGQYIGRVDDEQEQITKKTPTGIHLLDSNERIIDVLTNHSDKVYWDTKITEDMQDNLLTLDFTTLGTIDFSNVAKIVAQDQDGKHRLFLLSDIEKDHDDNGLIQIIHADGDHISLAQDQPIAPTILSGATAETAAQYILTNSRYQLGQVDFLGSRTVKFTDFMSPLAALNQIASDFDAVLRFRVEIIGNTIQRYVDILEPVDIFSGKEFVFGKDIIGLKRKENRADIVTRLVGYGPADEDGNFITFEGINDGKNYVEDADAYQRWNDGGRHRYGIFQYQPEDTTDVTPQKVLDATKDALKRQNDAAVEYELTGAALEQIMDYEHEKVRVGMTIRIKDTYFEPALYLEAEVLRTEMPEYGDPNGEFTYTFGNYREVNISIPDDIKRIQSVLMKQQTRWTVAKDLADAAQETATNAQNAANVAQQTADIAQQAADAAQADADMANAQLADLSNDSKLTSSEKQATKKEWDTIVAEKPTIDAQADKYAITTAKSDYDTSYTNLSNYITPLLADITTTSNIDGPTFRAKFKDYYDKRQVLLKAISDAAKQAADTAQQTAEQATQAAQAAQAAADAATQMAQNAQISADGKNTVFHQSTQPSTEGRKVGDLWFDTANGNRMYVWSDNAWTLTQLDYQALSVGQLSAISADLGNVTAGNITGVTMNLAGGKFIVDANGNVTFKGSLSGASGDFTGTLKTVEPSSGSFVLLDGGKISSRQNPVATGGNYVDGSFDRAMWNIQNKTSSGTVTQESKMQTVGFSADDHILGYHVALDILNGLIVGGSSIGLDGIPKFLVEPWKNVSFQNGWTNYDATSWQTAQYMKDPFGFVHLRGLIKGGTIGYVPAFNLPAGYRPSKNEFFGTTQAGVANVSRIEVATNGDVMIVAGDTTYTSLSGISFYAG